MIQHYFSSFPVRFAHLYFRPSRQFVFTTLLLILISRFAFGQYEAYPSGFGQVLVTNGLSYPTALAFAPDGRIFVAEQAGRLRVMKNDTLLPTSFVDLNVFSNGECGLLGIVLDPQFTTNQYIYVYYTVAGDEHLPFRNRISRFTANGDQALPGSEVIVLELGPLTHAEQHNGGEMAFGPDGMLYVSVGDSRNPWNSQNLETHMGKILRVSPNGNIPPGNPFPTGSVAKRRIWAYGLRNPHSFSFHPLTGQLFVNDVGEGSYEEINDATQPGQNFGWPYAEGYGTDSTHANPVFAYDHSGSQCAITGGVFFNPTTTTYPAEYVGRYFYQDFCTSAISTLTFSGSTVSNNIFGQHLPGLPNRLTVGIDGNLYFMSRNNSALYRIIYTSNNAPQITAQPRNTTATQGKALNLIVTTTGANPFTYQWQKNGVVIPGATAAVYSVSSVTPADSGHYCVVVSNTFGNVMSTTALVSVTIPNASPVVRITRPLSQTLYRAGETIPFSGTATDAEDGSLPASAYVWTVRFHHDTHYHDGPPIATGTRNGQYTIPNQGETASDVFYRFFLTVTDSNGNVGVDSVDVLPRLIAVTVATNRAGLQVSLNGPPVTTPHTQTFVVGLRMSLGAPASQTINGVSYAFSAWSNGPDSTGMFTVPDSSVTYKANYRLLTCPLPDSLVASPITDSTATLNWQTNAYTDQTRYSLQWRPEGQSNWTTMSGVNAPQGVGAYALTGLLSSTMYEWRLQTYCSPTNPSGVSPIARFRTVGTCTSVKTGFWNDATVWSCGRIPTFLDVVQLRHVVNIPAEYIARARIVKYTIPVLLNWQTGARLLLNVSP